MMIVNSFSYQGLQRTTAASNVRVQTVCCVSGVGSSSEMWTGRVSGSMSAGITLKAVTVSLVVMLPICWPEGRSANSNGVIDGGVGRVRMVTVSGAGKARSVSSCCLMTKANLTFLRCGLVGMMRSSHPLWHLCQKPWVHQGQSRLSGPPWWQDWNREDRRRCCH